MVAVCDCSTSGATQLVIFAAVVAEAAARLWFMTGPSITVTYQPQSSRVALQESARGLHWNVEL